MTLTTLHLSNSNTTVSYGDYGEGEPLMLLHGVGMQLASWGPQIATFSSTHRVIAVDLPGHGQSDPLPVGSCLEDYVNWLHCVVQNLALAPVNLAGHSMGALIASGFAVSYPKLVRRVAMLNGVYRRSDTARAAVIARADEIRQGKIDLETPIQRWFRNCPTEFEARELTAKWLGSVDPEGYATAYNAFAHGDSTYAGQLSNVTCPVLAMTADGDPNSTPEMSVAMAEQAPNGHAEVIKGHRHMVNLTAPDDVNAILLEWLKQPTNRRELQ